MLRTWHRWHRLCCSCHQHFWLTFSSLFLRLQATSYTITQVPTTYVTTLLSRLPSWPVKCTIVGIRTPQGLGTFCIFHICGNVATPLNSLHTRSYSFLPTQTVAEVIPTYICICVFAYVALLALLITLFLTHAEQKCAVALRQVEECEVKWCEKRQCNWAPVGQRLFCLVFVVLSRLLLAFN